MLEKEFVPYEIALALKELGFDEECFSFYNTTEMLISSEFLWKNSYSNGADIVAPLYQQAFRWFREEQELISWIYQSRKEGYFYSILKEERYLSGYTEPFKTYEEAELECLVKLIEIVKERKS
jgi:hypothetical protein